MDTTLTPRLKTQNINLILYAIGITVCFLIVSNLSISANTTIGVQAGINSKLNHITTDEEINKEILFNTKISQKYKGGIITDVDKGIKHIRLLKYYNNSPVRINVVEISRDINKDLLIEPTIASENLASRRKISNIAQRENAIIAINGGYFKPETGVPLGTLMINKKMYTGPIYDRVALGISKNDYKMSRLKLNASINSNIGGLQIDNINQPRMLSTYTIVYTRDWGKITPNTPKYGTQLVVENGKPTKLSKTKVEIPKNGFVIIGPEKNLNKFINAENIDLSLQVDPSWNNVEHIISGGPYLVKNNEIFVDMTAQKLTSIGGRNPRTAIGYTKDNTLIMITADGREGSSIGLTLMELANLMKELGCTNAMNLDGGGSTVMYVNNKIVNKPAEYGGIPLSHTLTVKYNNS